MSNKEYYAQYSLWNDSVFGMFTIQPHNLITFTKPVAGSIFLTPSEIEDRDRDSGDDVEEEQPLPSEPEPEMRCLGFERYMKRSQNIVTRESLLQDPALFKIDLESDEFDCFPDQSSERVVFYRPPCPRWRTPQQVHGRGRKTNVQQRNLEQAMAPRDSTEGEELMVHRMSWLGGALGCGVRFPNPVAPDPYYVRMLNAAYKNVNAGYRLSLDSDDSSDSDSMFSHMYGRENQRSKKQRKQDFIINVLKYICEFVKNDLQVEMLFEHKLEPRERKRIHYIVAKLMGKESEIEFDTQEMMSLACDIEHRNAYNLGTQSKGESPARRMCMFKEARPGMFLVTPEDIRYRQPEEDLEEETNPFLQSIARHHKDNDTEKEYTMLDRVLDFFIEFAAKDEYTVFRLLGAFTMPEIGMLSTFFSMVVCLIEKRPYMDYPEAFVKAFEKESISFSTSGDANGFLYIKKSFKDKEEPKELDEAVGGN